jgi:tetratricopeptide (TPR) repeat protein
MSHTIGQAKQDTQQSNSKSNSHQPSQDTPMPEVISSVPTNGLSDADYEFLFNQLLEGITHGWHDRRIIKFFNQLGDRGQQADWILWLERLRDKLSKLPPESKRPLGTMMIRLGELTQAAPEVSQIGAASHRIGRELLFGNTPAEIWEYTGADLAPSNEQIESEQELSARLPDDFSDLAKESAAEVDVDLDLDIKSEGTTNEFTEAPINPPTASPVERVANNMAASDRTASINTAPETESLEAEINQANLETASSKSASDLSANSYAGNTNEIKDETKLDLSLDLDLELEDTEQVSSYGDEFEFELDELEDQDELDDQSPAAADSSIVESTDELKAALDQQGEIPPNAGAIQQLEASSLEVIEGWFNLGLKQVSVGEYHQAIASWDKALKINANLPEAWHNRGSALGRLGDYEAAVKSFQSALALDPDNYQAWNDRAHALYQLENWSGAIESWGQAIKIMPGNHLFWYNRGCALEQLEKWQDAIASYEKALEIKPDFQPGRSRYINLVADNSRPN